jgi:hypothetical protein
MMTSNLRKNEFLERLRRAIPKHYLIVSRNQKEMVMDAFQGIFKTICIDKLTSIGRDPNSALEYVNSQREHYSHLFELVGFYTDKFFCIEPANAMSDDDFYIDEKIYRYLLEEIISSYINADLLFDFSTDGKGRADAAASMKLASRKLH